MIGACCDGATSLVLAGYGEITYPPVGGFVIFPAWAFHCSGGRRAMARTNMKMIKNAFFFADKVQDGGRTDDEQ